MGSMVGVASDALAVSLCGVPIMGRMPSSRALSLWLPVVIWAAVIFAFSSIPSLGTGLGAWDTILRKGAHMTEYAILGLLLLRALGRELPALALGMGYAITDEIHQHFVGGRHASPVDVLIEGCLEGDGAYADKALGLWAL